MSVYLMLIGCSDQPDHFFHTIKQSALDKEIEYSNIHRMNLDISHMTKSIDESGFSPSLNASFSLKNNLSRSWPQAWVAFVINISIKDKLLATMTKSDSLHNHTLKVSINQLLPKFGIKEKDIHINVVPISWMPTYPLIIQPAVAPK
jgi:hypothetical protein